MEAKLKFLKHSTISLLSDIVSGGSVVCFPLAYRLSIAWGTSFIDLKSRNIGIFLFDKSGNIKEVAFIIAKLALKDEANQL